MFHSAKSQGLQGALPGEAQTGNSAGSRGVSWQSSWGPGFCPWAQKRASFFSPMSKSRLLSRTLSTAFGKHLSSTGCRAGTVERALGFSDEKTRFPPSGSFQSMWRWTCKELSIHHGKCYSDSMSNLYIGVGIPRLAWRNLERLQGLGTLLGEFLRWDLEHDCEIVHLLKYLYLLSTYKVLGVGYTNERSRHGLCLSLWSLESNKVGNK